MLLVYFHLDEQEALLVILLAGRLNVISSDEEEVCVHNCLPLPHSQLRQCHSLQFGILDIHQHFNISLFWDLVHEADCLLLGLQFGLVIPCSPILIHHHELSLSEVGNSTF